MPSSLSVTLNTSQNLIRDSIVVDLFSLDNLLSHKCSCGIFIASFVGNIFLVMPSMQSCSILLNMFLAFIIWTKKIKSCLLSRGKIFLHFQSMQLLDVHHFNTSWFLVKDMILGLCHYFDTSRVLLLAFCLFISFSHHCFSSLHIFIVMGGYLYAICLPYV